MKKVRNENEPRWAVFLKRKLIGICRAPNALRAAAKIHKSYLGKDWDELDVRVEELR